MSVYVKQIWRKGISPKYFLCHIERNVWERKEKKTKHQTSSEAEGLGLESSVFLCLYCFWHPETNTEKWLGYLFQSTMPYSSVISFRFFSVFFSDIMHHWTLFPLCLLLDFCEMLPLSNGDQKLKILNTNNSNTIRLHVSSPLCLPSKPLVPNWMWVLISKFETYFKSS